MKDADIGRRLKELFPQRAPEPDPAEGTLSAEESVDAGSISTKAAPDAETSPDAQASPVTQGVKRQLPRSLVVASILGEAVATTLLIVVLYWYSPSSLRNTYILYVSASFAGLALILLFAQWLLARRLAQTESLAHKRARQLTQASALMGDYQQDLEWTQQAARRRETTRPR